MDARRCISYQTIENQGLVPLSLRERLRGHLFGCDVCQEVCPFNRTELPPGDPRFAPRPLGLMREEEVAALSREDFDRLSAGTALARAKYDGLRRNAILALGPARARKARALLERLAQDPSPIVRDAARWALDSSVTCRAHDAPAAGHPRHRRAGARATASTAASWPASTASTVAAVTPAERHNDGVDFVPTRPVYLLPQHFSAIAAAGPIAGPILACQQFGWLPSLLWIGFGVVFIGAVHDFSTLVASVRHDGRSIAEVVKANLGPAGLPGHDGLHLGGAGLRHPRLHRRDRLDLRLGRRRHARAWPSASTRGARWRRPRCSTWGWPLLMGLVNRFLSPPLWLTDDHLRARHPGRRLAGHPALARCWCSTPRPGRC